MNAPFLMPEPGFFRFLRGHIPLRDGDAVFLGGDAARLAPDLEAICTRSLGIRFRRTGSPAEAGIRLLPCDADMLRNASAVFGQHAVGAGLPPESYYMSMDGDGIRIAAGDREGFFYALQTLRQLAVGMTDAGAGDRSGRLFKRCMVLDRPHTRLRGVHVYLPAREHLPFCRRFIDGIASLKYNRICFEVSGMEFRRHPEINEAWMEYARDMQEYPEKAKTYQNGSHGAERPWYKNSIHVENAGGGFLTQDEVRDLVRYCGQRCIEAVPEVQSLSHCDYLVIPHREIAENPEDPYPDSYCPSNPRSYELLFDVIEEVAEVFRPRSVNIGHDEWYSAGRCPACRGKDAAALLAEDVGRIHARLASMGIRTEMWGDKLLDAHTPDSRGRGGARRIVENYETSEVFAVMPATWHAVASIPKDVTIGHWYWPFEPGGADFFARHGLENVFYANFHGADAKDWELHSRKANVMGGSLSHWDLLEEGNMAREGTLTDIVYSSFPLWNAGYTNDSWEKVRDITFDSMPRFMEILGGTEMPSRSCAPKDFVAARVRHGMRERYYLDTAAVELRNHPVTVIRHQNGKRYFRGALVTELWKAQSFRVATIGERVDSIVFRHATSLVLPFRSADKGVREEDYRIGHYTVHYADGTRTEIPISYGANISRVDAAWGRRETEYGFAPSIELFQAACRTRPRIEVSNQGGAVTFYDYEWLNPEPDKSVRTVDLTLEGREARFSIFVHDIRGIKLHPREARR